jgi:hypothetical protein
MTHRRYDYVGPNAVRLRVVAAAPGTIVRRPDDVVRWAKATGCSPARGGLLVITFVVDAGGQLRIADRHSEHVACAAGGPVLAAGEMSLALAGNTVSVDAVSNQSTGFCPEPASWPAVAEALDAAGIDHPGEYTSAYEFRRCPACGQTNLVKDGMFICEVCSADLPTEWNFVG